MRELEIDEAFIGQELNKNVSKYGFIGICLAKTSKRVRILELQKKKTFAIKYKHYKQSKDGGKVMADTLVKELIYIDDEYISSCMDLIKAEESEDILKHCVKTLENRSFMVQSISANLRAEANMIK